MDRIIKRVLIMVLALFTAFTFMPLMASADSVFAGGSGTEEDPYQIADKYQLDKVRDYPSASFILVNDIVFNDGDFQEGGDFYNPQPIADILNYNGTFGYGNYNEGPFSEYGWIPIENFSGNLDGNGHSICNLQLSRFSGNTAINLGLIGENSGKVSNLGIENAKFLGCSYTTIAAGGVCGENKGIIEYCTVSGSVSVPYAFAQVGGVAGNNNGEITGCVNLASVSIDQDVPRAGGIVCNNYGLIKNSINFGTINTTNNAMAEEGLAGGICNYNLPDGVIEDSYAYFNADNPFQEGSSVSCGSIVGANRGTIKDAYATTPSVCLPYNTNLGTMNNINLLSAAEALDSSSYAGFDFSKDWSVDESGLPYPSGNKNFENRVSGLENIFTMASNVEAQPYSYKEIKLKWDKLTGCDSIIIYSNGKVLANVGGDQTEYIHEIGTNSGSTYSIVPVWNMGEILFEGRRSMSTRSYVVDLDGGHPTPADTISPTINSYTASTSEVYAPGKFEATVDLEDSLSGIKNIDIVYAAVSDPNTNIHFRKEFSGENRIQEVARFSVESGIKPGEYMPELIKVTDLDGNVQEYNGWFLGAKNLVVKDEFDIEFTGTLSNQNVARELERMDEGKTVVLTMDAASNGVLRKECLDAIKGQDKTIVVYVDESKSLQWVFYGKEITGETKDLDLNVSLEPVDGSEYGSAADVIMLTFADNGELPGKVNFRFKTDYLEAIYNLGENVYIYYQNGNTLTLENSECSVIRDGSQYWMYADFTHNSVFLVSGDRLVNITGISDKTYTGKAIKPVPVITVDGKTLKAGTDYTVTYKNNKAVGKASAIITLKGDYSGTFTKYFKINPKATKLTSVKSAKKGFTAKWKKLTTQTSGYQLQYSTSKLFKSGNKTITISKNKTVSKKITKLKAKKKYYVRIRTYKIVKGTKYFSAWSSKRMVKTK